MVANEKLTKRIHQFSLDTFNLSKELIAKHNDNCKFSKENNELLQELTNIQGEPFAKTALIDGQPPSIKELEDIKEELRLTRKREATTNPCLN